MKTYRVDISGVSDLMFGKMLSSPKKDDETHEEYEKRVWKERAHQKNGKVFFPPFALKHALESAGKWLSMSIPGEGKKTYTKRFIAGVLIADPMELKDDKGKDITLDNEKQLYATPLPVPSNGERGGNKRVTRIFPTVPQWHTTAIVHVLDDMITQPVLEKHLETAGKFVGFGAMRVGNGGINGRFRVNSVTEITEE